MSLTKRRWIACGKTFLPHFVDQFLVMAMSDLMLSPTVCEGCRFTHTIEQIRITRGRILLTKPIQLALWSIEMLGHAIQMVAQLLPLRFDEQVFHYATVMLVSEIDVLNSVRLARSAELTAKPLCRIAVIALPASIGADSSRPCLETESANPVPIHPPHTGIVVCNRIAR